MTFTSWPAMATAEEKKCITPPVQTAYTGHFFLGTFALAKRSDRQTKYA